MRNVHRNISIRSSVDAARTSHIFGVTSNKYNFLIVQDFFMILTGKNTLKYVELVHCKDFYNVYLFIV